MVNNILDFGKQDSGMEMNKSLNLKELPLEANGLMVKL